jgi:membrane-bound inhibitor of C-type lysozyme
MRTTHFIIGLVVVIAVVAAAWFYMARTAVAPESAESTGTTDENAENAGGASENGSTYVFSCDAGKSITATFYPDNDTQVDLVLSDGRTLSVPHAISASGARYANEDESFVFWNKGNTAFITEGSEATTTYENCVTAQ